LPFFPNAERSEVIVLLWGSGGGEVLVRRCFYVRSRCYGRAPTQHSTVFTVFTLHILHSTPFHTPQFTVLREQGKKYKAVEIVCFTKVFYVTAFGFVGFSCFFSVPEVILANSASHGCKVSLSLCASCYLPANREGYSSVQELWPNSEAQLS